jgi:ParB-like chromosome segregation protein Spo0J/DNA-binding transcriptional regulator/RsmH inhibitor MraZ
MGKLTRRVKFIAKERRLSIPAEFLHRHGIERGDHIVLSSHRDRLYAFPVPTWERYSDLATHADTWFPEASHPFFELIRTGVRLRLGSQDRIVLPRDFPFRLAQSARLRWDLEGGVLRMEPEIARSQTRPILSVPTGQRNLLDLVGTTKNGLLGFDREEAERELVEEISVSRIDWRDRSFSSGSVVADESLVRSIRVEGLRRPIVLREIEGGFQVIDGFRRLAAARQLRMRAVPAIVWRGISDEDCGRIKLVQPKSDPSAAGSTLQRLQSTLRLHNDQVALREIEHITGRRKRTLQRYLRVAQHPQVRKAVESGRLSIFKAEEILKAGVGAEEAVREGWTVKQIRERGRKLGKRKARPRRSNN